MSSYCVHCVRKCSSVSTVPCSQWRHSLFVLGQPGLSEPTHLSGQAVFTFTHSRAFTETNISAPPFSKITSYTQDRFQKKFVYMNPQKYALLWRDAVTPKE